MKLGTCTRLSEKDKEEIFTQARGAAYAIIKGKKATYYAIGTGVASLLHTILHDKKTVLPVSHLINGIYGISDVCLSMPAVVGKKGITSRLCIELSQKEQQNLKKSAQVLREVYEKTYQ